MSSPGRSATSSSSPSRTSTTRSSRSGRWPTCRSCPTRFRLVVRDERSRKQMTVIQRNLGRDDVATVVNACDAGREGELIFAWLYEKAGAKKPVQRLWLSSMTTSAIKQAFGALQPGRGVPHARGGRALALRGRLDRRHERHARGDDPAALVVRRRGVARARADADARHPRPPRGRDPRVQAGEVLAGRRDVRADRRRPGARATSAATTPARSRGCRAPRRPRRSSTRSAARPATITKLETSTKKERAPLLYDLTSLQRDANTRYGFSARRTLAAAQRLYEEHKALTYPRTSSRFLSTDMVDEIKPTVEGVGKNPRLREAGAVRAGARRAAARPRGQRRQGHRPPRDHPDAAPSTARTR